MSSIPVRAVFDGDVLAWLVELDEADSMSVVAEKVAHYAVGVTVPALDRPIRVWHNATLLDTELTVQDAKIAPMDMLQVAYT